MSRHDATRICVVGAGGVIGKSIIRIILKKQPSWSVVAVEANENLHASIKQQFTGIEVSDGLPNDMHVGDLVIEAATERLDVKQGIYKELLKKYRPGTEPTFCSTSSQFMPSDIAGEPERSSKICVVAHPLNPPTALPIIELVGMNFLDPQRRERVRTLFTQLGFQIVELAKEIRGFVSNRLQAALLREALLLVEDGIITPGDVDKIVSQGLGLRWAWWGPFQTAHINTVGGFSSHAARLGHAYGKFGLERNDRNPWKNIELIRGISSYLGKEFSDAPEEDLRKNRENLIIQLRALKDDLS